MMVTVRRRRLLWLGGLLVVAALTSAVLGSAGRQPALVAAASDLQVALEELAARFEADGGGRVDLVFGSSGNLTRQMLDGAPFELFLSADEGFVEKLAAAGRTRDRGVLYAIGRVVVFAPHGSPLAVDERLEGLAALLARGRMTRFAIAHPAHAPYGRAAESVLRRRGVWHAVEPYLVLGENIAQTAQFATTGNAVGGIIAYSLVLAPPLRDAGTFALLPERDHAPLRQRMVLLARAGALYADR